MGNFRAITARSEVDREFRKHLSDAQKFLKRASEVCVKTSRSRDPQMAVEARRARNALQVLAQIERMMDQLGRLSPGYDRADPDLFPEALKTPPPPPPKKQPKVSFQEEVRRKLELMRDDAHGEE